MLKRPRPDCSCRTARRLSTDVRRQRCSLPPRPRLALVSLQAPNRYLPHGSSGSCKQGQCSLGLPCCQSVSPDRLPATIRGASASLGSVALLGSFPERTRRQLKAFHSNPRRGPPALQPRTPPPCWPIAGRSHSPLSRLPMCTVASTSPQPLSLISLPSRLGGLLARLRSYSRFIYHVRMPADTGRHEDTVTPHAEHRLTQGGAVAKLPYSAPPFRHRGPVEWS